MTDKIDELFEAAKHITLTDEEKEERRRSFAYGNAKLHNPNITRKDIVDADNKLKGERDETNNKTAG